MPPIGGTHKLNSGYEIPLIGIGTGGIIDQETVNVAIDAALSAGYRLIDTANSYRNEETIGNALQAFTSLGRQDPALINDPTVVRLAEKHKTTVNLVLLAYALVQGIGIMPKSVTPSRIRENMRVVNLKLTQEEVDELAALNRDKSYTLSTGWKVL